MGKHRQNDAESVARWVGEKLTREISAAIARGNTPNSVKIGAKVWREIRTGDRDGNCTAQNAVDLMGQQYVTKQAGDKCRGPKTDAVIDWNGEKIHHPTSERFGVPERAEDGAPKGQATQYPLFVDLPRDEYLALLARHERTHDYRGQSIAVLSKGAQLLLRFPAAPNLRAACKLAGQDWRDYLVDESIL